MSTALAVPDNNAIEQALIGGLLHRKSREDDPTLVLVLGHGLPCDGVTAIIKWRVLLTASTTKFSSVMSRF